MHVVVSEFGSFVGKKSERLVVKKGKETLVETPLFGVEQITIATSGASLSTDVIRECTERGIQINFLTSSGKPYAKLSSPNLTGTVATRREQVLAYLDERGVALSRAFVEGKMRNQAAVVKYFSKYRKDIDRELYSVLREGAAAIEALVRDLAAVEARCIDEARGQLLAMEGRAASIYWECVKKLLGGKMEFDGRERRGAEDPFNSLLNYGYGILYTQVWGAIVLAGLEAFAGFLHVDVCAELSGWSKQ